MRRAQKLAEGAPRLGSSTSTRTRPTRARTTRPPARDLCATSRTSRIRRRARYERHADGRRAFLKERKPDVKVYAVEPPLGEKVEGLRYLEDGYIPPVYEKWGGQQLLDGKRIVRPRESIQCTRRWVNESGDFAGLSSGAAGGAARVAERIDSRLILFIVCDGG